LLAGRVGIPDSIPTKVFENKSFKNNSSENNSLMKIENVINLHKILNDIQIILGKIRR